MLDAVAAQWAAEGADVPGHDPRLLSVGGAFLDSGFDIEPLTLLNHPWAGCPMFNLGVSLNWDPSEFVDLVAADDGAHGIDEATCRWLRDEMRSVDYARGEYGADQRLFDGVDEDGTVQLSEVPAVLRPVLERRASGIFRSLLVDAPGLVLLPSDLESWSDDVAPVRWHATDPSGAVVPMAGLSYAQQRWGSLSVRLAMFTTSAVTEEDDEAASEVRPSPRVLLLDEPERGLHPTAQRFLASGLQDMVREIGLQAVLATHAPALLGGGSRLRHVRRDRLGLVEGVELPTAFVDDLADLGLHAADLVQLTRAFVIVEGRHDELVLEHMIGDELRGRATLVAPLRGASKINAVLDARFIFDLTDARVIVMIDNIRSGVAEVWRKAVSLPSSDDARDLLLGRLDRSIDEERFLQEFGIRALEFGAAERLSVHGLSVPDVLDLLPPSALCSRPMSKSWAELRADPQAPRASGKFKAWAERELGASFDDDTIVRAARSADSIPDDLLSLLSLLDASGRL